MDCPNLLKIKQNSKGFPYVYEFAFGMVWLTNII
jgi:hypothetical protein